MSDSKNRGAVGKSLSRTDGRLKITGQARYTADMQVPNAAHAVFVQSTITRGKIKSFDVSSARHLPGVIAILTHQSGLNLKFPENKKNSDGKPGEGHWIPLQDAAVHFNGQNIAMVVAETLETAIHAADLVKVNYVEEPSNVSMEKAEDTATKPEKGLGQKVQGKFGKGEPDLDGKSSIEAVYYTPVEHHNPIEPHATLAVWDGDSLTVYESTQGVMGTRAVLADIFGMAPEKIRVISHFLGGGFGCKGFVWPHTALTAAAARKLNRPVKLVLSRSQMFTSNGHRSKTKQTLSLAAGKNGKLESIRHEATTQTSRHEDFVESCVLVSKMLYASPHIEISQKLVRVDTATPCPQRAPGEATGSFALECAMDEMAYKIGMDPLEFRMVNHTDTDPSDGRLFSSKYLKESYRKGAELFGWAKRKPEPRSQKDGRFLIGWGMATATYPANRVPASAKVTIQDDGRATAVSATQDLGTGTYTIMTQIAADALGMSVEKVRFELGNSDFPPGPVSGGSQITASVGNAVLAAGEQAREKLLKIALSDQASPLHGSESSQIISSDGRFLVKDEVSKTDGYQDILKRAGLKKVEVEAKVGGSTRAQPGQLPHPKPGEPDVDKYSFHSFGAQFAEVRVDPDLGTVRLGRLVGVFDVGKVINPKTARSQCIGGMMWGAGMALMEETIFDVAKGRIVTRNLADYHVPVHADTPEIQVAFVGEPDLRLGALGARGVGEIPITGTAAAIANAVYHATGKRIRDLPLVPEKLL